jgi:hypothetical protein
VRTWSLSAAILSLFNKSVDSFFLQLKAGAADASEASHSNDAPADSDMVFPSAALADLASCRCNCDHGYRHAGSDGRGVCGLFAGGRQ